MARRKQASLPDEVLDQRLTGGDPRDTLAGKDGLLEALAERAERADRPHHLNAGEPDGRANTRNGSGRKTVLTDTGRLAIEVPCDRLAAFERQLMAKSRRRLPDFDDKVVSLTRWCRCLPAV